MSDIERTIDEALSDYGTSVDAMRSRPAPDGAVRIPDGTHEGITLRGCWLAP
jgi:hypothetical protein